MDDNSIMPYGKYAGIKMANIPPEYLLWLYEENKCYGAVRGYIYENIDVIKAEINTNNKSKK